MVKKVLVVDDEEDLTWSINKNLADDKDLYELTCVNNAEEALDLMAQVPFSLVVSDIRMPGMTGMDLLMEIKQRYPSTKVIIMTAYGSADTRIEARKKGSLSYIEKPFEIEELRNLVIDAISEKRGFDGKVSDFALPDLIQMNIMARTCSALIVTKEGEQGTIYFDDGDIVHSECGAVEGEDAFYRIVSWEGGQFDFKKRARPPEQTIHKGWQSLLFEGLKRKDETGGKPTSELKEKEKSRRIDRIRFILKDILKVSGVETVAVVDAEGFSRASIKDTGAEETVDISVLTGIVPEGMSFFAALGKEVDGGGLSQVITEFDNRVVVISAIPGTGEFVFVVTERSVNLGGLRMELKKQTAELKNVI